MPPTPPAQDSAPPTAAELNEQIRALWIGGRGHPTVRLTTEQHAEYHRLLAALQALQCGDVVEAA